MRAELDAILFERYPLIFAERHGDQTGTAMYRGLECNDGWFTLIDALCSSLQFETEQDNGPQIVAVQVKEKFRSLRFRVRIANEQQKAMIDFASALSMRVCETCGASTSGLAILQGIDHAQCRTISIAESER